MSLSISDASDLWESLLELAPRPVLRTAEWAQGRIVNETGRPYDHAAYPHLAAPGGPFDAWDSDFIRVVVMQWGVRLGKTFGGQCMLLANADQRPGPQMYATSVQKLAKESVSKLLDLIEKSRLDRTLLGKPRSRQRSDLITFRASKLYLAWSRSASTLADKNIRDGHANEVDKWEHASTASEGDPLELFFDRFNDFLSIYKCIVESTPAIKGRSRVERWRLQGSNCSLWVPCPHCGEYQVLVFGDRSTKHGIKWDSGPDGRSNPELAEATARYVCRHCVQPIEAAHRRWMYALGVWVPEGCTPIADVARERSQQFERPAFTTWADADWVTGTPTRPGSVASYHLPAWYALKIPDWGFFAKRFVRVAKKRSGLQVFRNQMAAETWEAAERTGTWEDLGSRAIHPGLARGVVPADTLALVLGCDKQGDRYVWVCDAFRSERRVHTVAYGECPTTDTIRELLTISWPTDSGGAIRVNVGLIDCGFRPREIYTFCRAARIAGLRLYPARGASVSLNTFAEIRKLGERTSNPGQKIVWVDMASSQDWLEEQLHTTSPDDPGGWTLHAGSLEEHSDFLQQLLNDGPEQRLGDDNVVREKWIRRDEDIPNDFRDCRRYAGAAWLFRTRGMTRPAKRGKPTA